MAQKATTRPRRAGSWVICACVHGPDPVYAGDSRKDPVKIRVALPAADPPDNILTKPDRP
ncbi:MAG TPA: hypothetical protein DD444_06105 [Citreicella sp.]|nr:hypothetical protein [Citreicella sp.]